MRHTVVTNLDFADFFVEHPPRSDDMVFLDPPYDFEFTEYDGNMFDRDDQTRLADWLKCKCQARFMVVIGETPFIRGLYTQKGLTVETYAKTYAANVKGRNKNADVTHLCITNYDTGQSDRAAA